MKNNMRRQNPVNDLQYFMLKCILKETCAERDTASDYYALVVIILVSKVI